MKTNTPQGAKTIQEALAECIATQSALDASPQQHKDVNEMFLGVEMLAAQIASLISASRLPARVDF